MDRKEKDLRRLYRMNRDLRGPLVDLFILAAKVEHQCPEEMEELAGVRRLKDQAAGLVEAITDVGSGPVKKGLVEQFIGEGVAWKKI